jgi:tRNA (cmo5U34)-methyltransferase
MNKILGDKIKSSVGAFNFGKNVHKRFVKHIIKSVPFYLQGHELISRLSSFFLVNGSLVYDLGCSTGKLAQDIYNYNQDLKSLKIIGLDDEIKMVKHSQKNLNKKLKKKIIFKKMNILKFKFKKSDFISSYYTIQFIKPKFRQNLFDKIYLSLNHGGAFVMFEKIRGNDARFQDIFTQVYHEFKINQGFSKEEVYNKSLSIRGVLEPFTYKANLDFLKRSGFKDITTIMQYGPFVGYMAIK